MRLHTSKILKLLLTNKRKVIILFFVNPASNIGRIADQPFSRTL